ncbi:MAG: malto-oligosyltrehalose synthase [Gammaproteobacteria bacterium]|nr:malto-oligosyltrehalose synthase [Gammaproteobacteria bacterium]NIR30177.1 malto-oligosyltrehalose synthase [Gammaproteobacteria bacterium]NIR98103.1 malto-oligosyltrehalose synthase [Gammaproteobacteria bacterium]NIT63793.1 malto-oligosyltrehalose synthase [Gammaproteobacteria bacterium]NIV20744.1 malto-oligosyltrehalose synthase [Gammaproteobacteria bacterium]
MSEPLLERLATLCGIQPEYRDIWGQRHAVSEETQRALLAAMGIEAADEAAVRAAVEEREQRPWRRILPPVQVVRGGDREAHIPVIIPEAHAARGHTWALITEDGTRRVEAFVPRDLPRLGGRRVDGRATARYKLVLGQLPAPGYHRLEVITSEGETASLLLIVAPQTCYTPPAIAREGRIWGPTVQLYALRSARNWGMGDFTDLRLLVDCCAELGADVVGLNPLHALFPHDPRRCGPYGPSSRLFLNVLYIDLEAVAEFSDSEAAQRTREPELAQRLRAARGHELIDYADVAALKLPMLEALYRTFRERHLAPGSDRAEAFRRFQAEGGEALHLHSLFEALQEHFHHQDPRVWGWPVWPEAYRDPSSPQVAEFAEAHRERLEFYQYLQWQAETQLCDAGQRALDHHLGVGLYEDLAVSVDRAGAEAWAHQDLYAVEASIGSPPDDFNLKGQDWGLPPLVPDRLFEAAYAPFIHTLRRNMRYTGALRIDHVMALMRLFWIPPGGTPRDGAYVHYPFEDLLGVLALESQRSRCLVVGEDLGTVPEEVRNALQPLDVLSYRLFYFEKDADGAYVAPQDYPEQALVAVSTHDLPTLAGFWEGHDITLRHELDLFPSPELRERQTEQRARDRVRLLAALDREQLLPSDIGLEPANTPEMVPELASAIHRYLARTPARVMTVQLEDVLGLKEQINLPGTVTEHPNWRRRLPLLLEDLCYDPRLQSLAKAIAGERQPNFPKWVERAPEDDIPLPRATYRLQFNAGFTFAQAAELVPYLGALGISHCYASPYLMARPGSAHGYDVIDHSRLNPEIGTDEDFDEFCETLQRNGMGQILDIVPNHMGVMGGDNPWWLDVLENGPASAYAPFFDIDWNPAKDELRGKVLVPVLGDQYGRVLEGEDLVLEFDAQNGVFQVRYFEHVFPVDPREYPRVLERNVEQLEYRTGPDDPAYTEFRSLAAAFGHLPPRSATDAARLEERNRDKEIHKRRLATLCSESGPVAEHVAEAVRELNLRPGSGELPLLHGLLERQAYRLAYWRVAADEINYRRFFDINELAGLRMENEQVFDATHRRVLSLLERDQVAGLRIDHPDGLYDPLQYYRRLHTRATAAASHAKTADSDPPPVYIVVEKILAGHEHLREEWPVHGTSGYDFAVQLNGLFVDPRGEKTMERLYTRFTGSDEGFDEHLYQSKKLLMKASLASELTVLANRLNRISERDPKTRDFTLTGLRDALMEVVASFPVYRTYVTDAGLSDEDRNYVEWAVRQAKKRSTAADVSVFDFVRSVLVLEAAEGPGPDYRDLIIDFAMRFQQYTSPVMAKGMEDTAFYRYNRLVSLNEVGGDPRRFGISVSAFHHANQERARRWPHTMLGSSTHDSKRSEDVRARIDVLSEVPEQWRARVMRWRRLNRSKKRSVDDRPAPDANDEYLLYQTLVGAWPLEKLGGQGWETLRERIQGYMLKAAREAKTNTSWINQNEEYEDALLQFTASLLDPRRKNMFLADFVPFQRQVSLLGMYNGLSQTVLKLCSPGVPDIYQGNELWTFQLVDPDNRRPVDYARRRTLLEGLKRETAEAGERLPAYARALVDSMADGRIKLYVTWRVLELRRRRSELFKRGAYTALECTGAHAERLCGFLRSCRKGGLMVIAPRLLAELTNLGEVPPLGDPWGDTAITLPEGLPPGEYRNIFSGKVHILDRAGSPPAAADLLRHFPVAVLASAS